VSLKGAPELRARLKGIRLAFKPAGRQWADETVKAMRPMIPVQKGRLRRSVRRRNATQRKATVVAHYTAFFVSGGAKRHTIRPKTAKALVFKGRGGRTIFARRGVNHPGVRARPFRVRAAQEGLRRAPLAQSVIDEWNRAA
jgi:hypothetical protein